MEKIRTEKEHFELFDGAKVKTKICSIFSLIFSLRTKNSTRKIKLSKFKLTQEILFKRVLIAPVKPSN